MRQRPSCKTRNRIGNRPLGKPIAKKRLRFDSAKFVTLCSVQRATHARPSVMRSFVRTPADHKAGFWQSVLALFGA
jgi:hypothetical protein